MRERGAIGIDPWDRRVAVGGTGATHPASARVALDAMALHQPPEGATVLLGFARRAGDVAIVLAEQVLDVGALERFDGPRPRLAEAVLDLFARLDAREVRLCVVSGRV